MASISASPTMSLTKERPKGIIGFVKFACPNCKATIQTDYRMEKCPLCNKALPDPRKSKTLESGTNIIEEVTDGRSEEA